ISRPSSNQRLRQRQAGPLAPSRTYHLTFSLGFLAWLLELVMAPPRRAQPGLRLDLGHGAQPLVALSACHHQKPCRKHGSKRLGLLVLEASEELDAFYPWL